MKTSRYIFILLISVCSISAIGKEDEEPIPKAPVFCGVAVQAELSGPVMKAVGARFDQLECGARLNFRDHYFPIVELGIGESTRSGQQNQSKFHTRAPYFRVGMDYNLRKKHNGNRLFVGARYAFSSFKYDFTDPDFSDPVWGGPDGGLSLNGQQGRMQWFEAKVGVETKIWSFIRLGWDLRFKGRIHQKTSLYGEPYYVPGFGKNGGSTFGGSMNIIFDLGRTVKKQNKTEESKKQ